MEILIRQNLKKSNLLVEKLEKLEMEFKRAQLVNFIRFVIVAVPIILAILYLIPLFRQFLEIYKPLLDLINEFRTF